MRGAAALAVVVFHTFLFTGLEGQAAAELPVIGWLIGYGYLGVPIFIVLSGYVLMLPLTKSPTLQFRGGVGQFFKRRAKRILPPYFAALAISLALIAFIPVMNQQGGTAWDSKIPVDVGGVVSHLLLLHDVSPDWAFQIDGPLWSVAVEWQIYFLMPLILLPLFRRFSPWIVTPALTLLLLAASLVGFAPWAHPWLVGLFAAGMFAAQLTTRPTLPRGTVGWLTAAAIGAAALLLVLSPFTQDKVWFSEIIGGAGFMALLVVLGRRTTQGASIGLFAVFESKPLRYAGLVSYSVYLIHSPLLALGNLLLLPLGLPVAAQYTLMMLVVVPVTLALCWAFFQLVERHFQNSHQTKESATLTHHPAAP
ncbi:acyltransferase [Cryobacterium melibiosiphilum]|uniref:Acyltransferase n=2 Tax=Cryobacterium melibiosiphilum TaxID=995039 RepID=A0A3A5MV32_9MICO|nr:acyltransferase [Cryobacterium melibiosiphilum]